MVIGFISLLLSFNSPELLFLKGMTGALAPFSYLVYINEHFKIHSFISTH